MLPNSARARWTARAMRSLVSSITIDAMSSLIGWRGAESRSPDQGTDSPLAGEDTPEVALGERVVHDDREAVVHAEGDGGGVHHPEALVQDVHVGDLVELGGRRIELGVGGVDAVDPTVG